MFKKCEFKENITIQTIHSCRSCNKQKPIAQIIIRQSKTNHDVRISLCLECMEIIASELQDFISTHKK